MAMKRALHFKLRRMSAGLSRVQGKRIEKQAERAVNRKKLMEAIIARRFLNERTRSYGGRKWKSLSQAYKIWRARRYPQAKGILWRTGTLAAAASKAVANTYRMKGRISWQNRMGRLPKYSQYVNRIRPFFLNPDKRELEPANKYAYNYVAKQLRKAIRR